jgi:hypothetical protein
MVGGGLAVAVAVADEEEVAGRGEDEVSDSVKEE